MSGSSNAHSIENVLISYLILDDFNFSENDKTRSLIASQHVDCYCLFVVVSLLRIDPVWVTTVFYLAL